MVVRAAKCPWLEVSSGRKVGVIIDLRSPLDEVKQSCGDVPQKKKGTEYERWPHYSHIPILRNRVRASTALLQTMTRH